ncbi:hypothetical protein ACJIZ3_019351 [Penstemon smallii]|uniref:Uncharacterized protein n=1 Tax=Penstemon smallii TaxID=265156 RepID=A0ABD3T0Y0_9LAMI
MEEEKRRRTIVCKRCKQPYTATSNTKTSCRFHPSFFVCRRHDDQKSCCPYALTIVILFEFQYLFLMKLFPICQAESLAKSWR